MGRIIYVFLLAFIFLEGCAAQETVKEEPPQVQEIKPGQKSFITPPLSTMPQKNSNLEEKNL